MIRLGITGGIGSGKSFVSQILREDFAVPVYDCDAEAKRLIQEDPEIHGGLVRLVGADVYGQDGQLDKKRLADFLFASAENGEKVNAIVHPAVRRDFREWCCRQETSTVAMESAILCESGFDSEVDEVVFVEASMDTRLARAMRRDGATEAQIRRRMEQQDDTLARNRAKWIIQNDENITRNAIIEQIKTKRLC